MWDLRLERTMVMKVIHRELDTRPAQRRRFVLEARVTAQLQHPAILPVHDLGELDDGRLYYTMKEVEGRTLGACIQELHQTMPADRWPTGVGPWTLRGLIDALRRAAEGVGYAHSRGVVHRDFKPSNVMIGPFSEVIVLDWGLAALRDRPDERGESVQGGDAALSRAGTLIGTVAYMAPEQMQGVRERVGPRADVFALGAVLYEVLTGGRAFPSLDLMEALANEGKRPLVPPSKITPRPVPPELERSCLRALTFDPEERFANGRAFAEALRLWQEGVLRREKGLALVQEARAMMPVADDKRARAARLRRDVEQLSRTIPSWADVSDKQPMWNMEDEADALEREAERIDLDMLQLLRAALSHEPDLDEAHATLADHHQREHRAAERRGDERAAARAAQLLRYHDRGRYQAYLKGRGRLTVTATATGATARLSQYVARDRRLVRGEATDLGLLPVMGKRLPRGSYELEISAPGHETVRLPVVVRRQADTRLLPPGSDRDEPVRLPPAGTLGEDDVFVAAGWATIGDPLAFASLPTQDAWVDDFVIKRDPVTTGEFAAFLNDMVARGQVEEAEKHAPRQAALYGVGPIMWHRGDDGSFLLQTDDGPIRDNIPICWVDWFGARAYAAWLAEREGVPWRLPGEVEWEKAARGVDGRAYPMGNMVDPSWACLKESHEGKPIMMPVDAFPLDLSPYGVRGMAGNTLDWCEELYKPWRDDLDGRVGAPVHEVADPGAARVLKGGFWWSDARDARCGFRMMRPSVFRFDCVSFRLARSL